MGKIQRRSLRLNWMGLISVAVLISLLGSTLMLFTTVRSSLSETFSEGNAVHVESATREVRMLTEKYEKSVEHLARTIQLLYDHTENVAPAIDALLQETQSHDVSLLGVYFTSASTGKLHSSPTVAYEQDAREVDTYELALHNQETSWTDVHYDEVTSKMIVSIVTPVMMDNESYGVVGFDVDLDGIGALRESNEMFGKNKLIIYDNQGLIVSSFMKGMDGMNIDPTTSGKANGIEDIFLDSNKMKKEFSWVENIAAGKRSDIQFQWDDVKYSGEVSFVYSMDWTVVSFVDQKSLNRSLIDFLKTSAIAMAIGLFIGAFAAYYIATQLLKVINKLRLVIFKTAEGDLVTEFDYAKNDEIGDLAKSYNAMLSSIRTLIDRVNHSVEIVEKTAGGVMHIANENVISGIEIARSTDEIASGATDTSLDVEKGLDAVHHLSKEIGTLIEQSHDIELVLADSSDQVEKGNMQVEHLETSYVQLEQSFKEVTAMVTDLYQKSQSISLVTNAITDIAEKTKILSINATIEASRAGQYGRGIAVVANEVRNLAEQAKQSAEQIRGTVTTVLAQTNQLVTVVSHTNEVNDTQKNAVSQVSLAMKMMTDSLVKMSSKVQEEFQTITSIERQKGVVVASIENISSVTELTTSSTQQIASAIEVQTTSTKEVSEHANHLVALVADLKQSVSKFNLGE